MKARWIILVIALIPLLAMIGCKGDTGPTGPAGNDGTDGTDGVDGNVTCLACHGTDAQNSISLQYDRSGHAVGENVDYAGGRASCARCHSHEGFVETMNTGGVDADFTNPSPINCGTCHGIHDTFEEDDYALRLTDAVAWEFDEDYGGTSVDLGDNSNMCAYCHQTRRAEPAITNPGEETFYIAYPYWGPHHGPQANVMEGLGMAEIAGTIAYPDLAGSYPHKSLTCVDCHMDEYAEGTGGHTWEASLGSCVDCHGTLEDFDYNGVQTEMEADLETLRFSLEMLGVIEYDEEDAEWHPVVGTHDADHARAFFNWIGLVEDRSLGVHNPRYFNALVKNSIEATPH